MSRGKHFAGWLGASVMALLAGWAGQAAGQGYPLYRLTHSKLLTQGDMAMLDQTGRDVNNLSGVKVGDSSAWSNPQSGNSGSVSVTRIFNTGTMPCHALEYKLFFKANRPDQTYRLNWCKTASGEWKSNG